MQFTEGGKLLSFPWDQAQVTAAERDSIQTIK